MYTYTVKKSDWSETSYKTAFSGSHVNKVTIFQHPTIFTDTGRDPQYSNGRICSPPGSNVEFKYYNDDDEEIWEIPHYIA